MTNTSVLQPSSTSTSTLRVIAAFFAIYFLWGTTFLAIRIAVHEVPPLFAAGARFFLAGVLLFTFMRLKGQPGPTRIQWRSLAIIALLMFVAEYGPLFWAEKYIPSGVTALLVAIVPILTIVIEVFVLRHQPFRWVLLAATILGFLGVGILVMPSADQHFALVPCVAVLAGSACFALGSILTRSLPLPQSRPLTSGATMMLGGGVLLALSASFGELHPFPHISLRAVLALLYLIVFGSLVAFTAYVWLLGRMPAIRVSSYAYVNPIVAVALGYLVAGELVNSRMLLGAALVVTSVILTLRKPKLAA